MMITGLASCLGCYQAMLSQVKFVLCTLIAVLLVSGESSHADVLVCSFSTNEILRYDQATGAYLGVFASHNRLSSPEEMVFGPDGNLYVTTNNFYTDEDNPFSVLRFDGQTGAFIDEFSRAGAPFHGLAFGPDGNLYASVGNSGVARFDGSSGVYINDFSLAMSSFPTQLLFGPDGNLYVVASNYDQVLRFDGTTGAPLGAFASGGGLDEPDGLAFGPDGNLYVGSWGTNSILRYNGVTGAFIDTFASGSGLLGPSGLAFGPDGNLYVTMLGVDQNSINKVLRYNGVTGEYIDDFVSGGGLVSPRSIVFTPTQAAPEQIIEVIQQVASLNLQQGIKNSLDAKLNAAFEAAEVENHVAAINSLNAFINAVKAQRGKKISATDADSLIAAAQTIIAILE